MRLCHWNRAAWDVEFNPVSGAAVLVKRGTPAREGEPITGFAQFERRIAGARQVFALFRSGDSIVFSAGATHWRLGEPGRRFEHSRGLPFLSRFRVLEGDRVAFSIHYSHVRRLLVALIDPTYDKLEQDSDFFLEFVAEHAHSADWRAHVLERWVSGPAV